MSEPKSMGEYLALPEAEKMRLAALPPVRSEPLLAFYIPSDLAEAFDSFVTAACAAIDCTDREGWSDDERRVFEWMESDKWKANEKGQR